MFILSVCKNPEILKVIQLIKIVISAIMVATPIILIVVSMIDVAKLVADPDPNVTKKGPKIFLYRFIACAIIMAVPTLVSVLTGAVDSKGYEECITMATSENISSLYLTRAETLVTSTEKSLSRTDLSLAQIAVNKIEDETSRKNLQNRLDTAEASIKKKEEEQKQEEGTGKAN